MQLEFVLLQKDEIVFVINTTNYTRVILLNIKWIYFVTVNDYAMVHLYQVYQIGGTQRFKKLKLCVSMFYKVNSKI